MSIKYVTLAFALFSLTANGQESQLFSSNNSSTKGSWTIKNPFKNEVFIENNGQFDNPDGQPLKNVKYAINNGELRVYFTPSGINYHIINLQPDTQYKNDFEEIKEKIEHSIERRGKAAEKLKKYFNDKSAYVNIEWEGANPNTRLEVSDKVHETYSYVGKDANGNPIVAAAFKKLTYKNIYPNIDIEYYFLEKYPDNPQEKLGIKYNIIVYPGGDLSKVKMKYRGMQNISLDEKGNVVVAIPDGNVTDHAPGFSYAGNQTNEVIAKYILQDQTVSFNVSSYDNTQKLVIDPFTSVWSISPGFTNTNDGYTIRIDYNHNVYVMGGGVSNGGFTPSYNYQVKKFNSSGILQWTATGLASTNLGAYGDMIVLRGGKVIVGMGIGAGNTGYILATANGAITTKAVAGENEFGWRLSYNLAVNNGVLWYGGGSDNGSHLCKTDTNLVAATLYCPWGTAGNTEDICYLAQDPNGSNIYVTNSTNTNPNSSTSAPKFCKSSAATPGTAIWKVNEPSIMMELGQGSFMNGGAAAFFRGWSTGVNGMVVCSNRIYTYDGNNIRSYDAANGATINTTTSGGTFDKYSGLDADNCCRLYVGVNGVVKRYSSTLAFDQSIAVTNNVFDLKLDPQDDKILYVTGKGFVQKINMYCPTCISTTQTNVSGCTYGTATATVNDPAATAPLTYSWNTSPVQTTQTATGLVAGTYIVTVTDGAVCPLTWKDTVVITGTFVPCGPTVTATGGVICSGACTTITAAGASTPGPFTYTWNPGALIGSSTSVCPTTTTTYTVTAKDGAGATATTTAVVTVNPAPAVSVPPATICSGTSMTLTASGATTYAWDPGTGLNSTTGTSVTANPTTTTTYTVTGTTTASGCTGSTTVVVTVNPNPVVSVPPATICAGNSTSLAASGANTYIWSPSTGLSASTGSPVTANPTVTTTYTVTGTTASGCTGSTTVVVTVGALVANAGSDVAICSGNSTTLGASGGTIFTWTPATGLSNASISNPVANPTTTTTYTVLVSDGNCSDDDVVIVTVNPNPVVSVPPATICSGASATLTASGATTYTWSPTTGLSAGTGTSVTANPTATTTYTVTGYFATGCTGVTTVVVTLNPNPTVSSNPATICQGQSTPLTASGADTYTWSPTTGLSAGTGSNVTANPTATTTYTIVGTITATGCTGSATVVVTVIPPCGPSVSATGMTVCNGVCAVATSTASGGVPPYTYSWSSGGATTSSINVCPTVTTSYTVTVTDNSTPIGSASALAVITVNPNPMVSVPPATICNGSSATLTAAGATTYSWTPTTGLSSGIGATVTANPTTTTTYTVTGSYATGCTGTTTVVVTVNPIPVVSVPNASICPGGSTVLNATGATTYTWTPTTGLSSGTGASVTANPATTTTYTVVGTSLGCTTSTTVVVSVGVLVANAGPDVFICYGASTGLNASGGTIFTWSPATGLSNASISNPTANPTTTTTYTVTVSDGFCSDDDVVVVTVNPQITLNAAGIDVTCFGACNGQLIVIPSGGTSPYSYSWSSGCAVAACNNICAGTYNLTATDFKGCTATATATVNEPPALAVSTPVSTNVSCFGLCDGTFSVSASGGTPGSGYTYSWTPSGGGIANATALCAGSYTCTVTDANNCTVKTTTTISQPKKVTVNAMNASICQNECANISVIGSGGTGQINFSWSPNVTAICPTVTTTYTITGTDSIGCTGFTNAIVTVNPAPIINVPSATICEGAFTTLVASGANTYAWSPSLGLSSGTGTSVTANPTTTSTYTIIGTNAFGCTNSNTVVVNVNPVPIVTAIGGNACPGDSISLTASGAVSYTWSPSANLNTTTGATVITKLTNTTLYTVTGIGANGCTNSATAVATVNPKPTADFYTNPNKANEFDPTIYFYDKSTGGTMINWIWSFGDSANTISYVQNPVFEYPPYSYTYPIRLIVTNQYGCIDTVTGNVTIHGVFTFYIPNTFTPNEDGINDGFLPKGVGIDEDDYHLWIFDRWGNLIWETTIWGEGWDGKANGGAEIAQMDTYVWKVHVKEKDSGHQHNYIGHVNIVK